MFDMNQISKRYWDVKLKDGQFLSVECPKLKTLRKITDLSKDKENIVGNLSEALAMALNKNKQGTEISADYIEETFDFDDINSLLTSYFEWVKGVKNNPN